MKPSLPAFVTEAFREGFLTVRQNLRAMLALEAAMGLVVALYYLCPAATAAFSHFAVWARAGGVLAAACASSLAGGLLSEASAVYLQDGGRWTRAHLENAAFKMALFFLSGAMVYEFYALQAVWFGNGPAWWIVLPKVVVDQFIYTPFWGVPLQATLTRWQILGYSGRKLRRELNGRYVTERLLPVFVTNFMFWCPCVIFIYSMPQDLQMPLAIFGNAIWGLLLATAARQPRKYPTGTTQDLIPPAPLPQAE